MFKPIEYCDLLVNYNSQIREAEYTNKEANILLFSEITSISFILFIFRIFQTFISTISYHLNKNITTYTVDFHQHMMEYSLEIL